MQITCSDIIDTIRADFGALWSCAQRDGTLEISTPFLLPNNDALSLYVTTRGSRIIVSEAGFVDCFLDENAQLDGAALEGCINYFTDHHSIKIHIQGARPPHYYKETESLKMVSSLIFDLGNFVVALCNAAIPHATVADEAKEYDKFVSKADAYIKSVIPATGGRRFKKSVDEIPGVRFGSVILTDTHVWMVGYVTGATPSSFVRNVALVYTNFVMARESSLCAMASLVALVNDDAPGFRPEKQAARLALLPQVTEQETVKWKGRNDVLLKALTNYGPKLSQWTGMVGRHSVN